MKPRVCPDCGSEMDWLPPVPRYNLPGVWAHRFGKYRGQECPPKEGNHDLDA